MKLVRKHIAVLLLFAAPLFSIGLSSCGQQDQTDPVMKTTRLNESQPVAPKQKNDTKKGTKKDHPDVQSFQTNYTVGV